MGPWFIDFCAAVILVRGPGSVVGIATGYGLDGTGIESRWGEIFRTCPDRPWAPPSLLYNGYRVFRGGKERPGRDADPSSLLVPWSRKVRAIPLLPLWAVRSVQSLSSCTRVHFNFTLLSLSRISLYLQLEDAGVVAVQHCSGN
jgi:hypothetical protein